MTCVCTEMPSLAELSPAKPQPEMPSCPNQMDVVIGLGITASILILVITILSATIYPFAAIASSLVSISLFAIICIVSLTPIYDLTPWGKKQTKYKKDMQAWENDEYLAMRPILEAIEGHYFPICYRDGKASFRELAQGGRAAFHAIIPITDDYEISIHVDRDWNSLLSMGFNVGEMPTHLRFAKVAVERANTPLGYRVIPKLEYLVVFRRQY